MISSAITSSRRYARWRGMCTVIGLVLVALLALHVSPATAADAAPAMSTQSESTHSPDRSDCAGCAVCPDGNGRPHAAMGVHCGMTLQPPTVHAGVVPTRAWFRALSPGARQPSPAEGAAAPRSLTLWELSVSRT